MAYNQSKGPRQLGDIKNENDDDTQIDFENDFIAFKTNDEQRLIISGSYVTSSLALSCSLGITASSFLVDGDATFGSVYGLFSGSGNSTFHQAIFDRITAGTANINGGTVDGAFIGAITQGSGQFTTLSASSTLDIVGISRFGPGNDAAISAAGVISASSPATLYKLNTYSVTASGDSHFLGNVGIGTQHPVYDLHVNGAGVTVTTIDGGAGSDSFLRFATNGLEKSFIKLGSGGNFIIAQDATGGDLLLQAKPGGVNTTYLTLNANPTAVTSAVDTYVLGATHHSGSNYRKYVNKDTDYTLTSTDNIVYMDTISTFLTASLPDATSVDGIVYTIKNTNSNEMVIKPNGAQTIDGVTSITGTIGQSYTLGANGDVWLILSSHSSSV